MFWSGGTDNEGLRQSYDRRWRAAMRLVERLEGELERAKKNLQELEDQDGALSAQEATGSRPFAEKFRP